MSIINQISSIRFDSYKSFLKAKSYTVSLDKNIILFIGRNNCGKSSIVDVIESVFTSANKKEMPFGLETVCPSFILDKQHIANCFKTDVHTIDSAIGNDFSYGMQFLGRNFTAVIVDDGEMKASTLQIETYAKSVKEPSPAIGNWNRLAMSYRDELHFCSLRRVNADRDIVPEFETDEEDVQTNGEGATNLVRMFVNTDEYSEAYVEKTILEELNKIMFPDAVFSAIRIQQVGTRTDKGYRWEIFLEEGESRYATSKCGSGLKTILLILINLFLIPQGKKHHFREFCFAFEEIENNLHPALQRRVFEYLYSYATENDIKIFITSHSHIAINTYFGKDKARIYHIVKTDGKSSLQDINNGSTRGDILDDLDVRASDLYQSNGIIWVEGPTDRIYILKWLEVFTNNRFTEGLHFQFLYYGGRLLSHYKARENEESTDGLINVLTTNRHAALVMDSDKLSPNGRINATKRRVRDELAIKGFYCWITKGKEIENYISAEAVNATYGTNLSQIGQYQKFPEYIKKNDRNYALHKVESSRKIAQNITASNSEGVLDLKVCIEKLYNEIEKWNKSGDSQ